MRLGEVALPKDIIDQDLDCKDLALKTILTDKTSLAIPVALGYIASSGDKIDHQETIPPDANALTCTLHLAYVHPLNKFFPKEDKMDLVTNMTLSINDTELVDK